MQYGEFISFSATTVFEQIKRNDFQVTEELLRPFLICKSDYDMQSFSCVYLGTIHLLKEENRTAAIALSEIVMRNTIQVWRRGTYYRETLKKMPNDGMMRTRVLSILKYVGSIIAGMKQIWITMPKQISNLCDELQKTIADELA